MNHRFSGSSSLRTQQSDLAMSWTQVTQPSRLTQF